MAVPSDMDRHFTELSSVYRGLRTTDREPVERIAGEIAGLTNPMGADIGCGDGRYDLVLLESIPGLYLTCVDANRAMLEQVHGLLSAHGYDRFETRLATAERVDLDAGRYDFVASFNAVHHFDLRDFLAKSSHALARGGHLFVYTRLPAQNRRSIWGRYFPGFADKETRLYELGDLHHWIEETPGMRFAGATCLRYRRRSTPERLVELARRHHYSTFSLYQPEAFEAALASFRRKVRRRFGESVEWFDENVLVHARRIGRG